MAPQNDEERLARIEAALLDETATDQDFQWMFDRNGDGEKLRSWLIEEAEATLRGEGRVSGTSGMPDDSTMEIITTPLGQPTPTHARQKLMSWARLFGSPPPPAMERLHPATLPWMVRAKFLLIAIGGPDGIVVRAELQRRQRHRAKEPERPEPANTGQGRGPGVCGDPLRNLWRLLVKPRPTAGQLVS